MIEYETDEIIKKRFKSLLESYQKGLEERMRKISLDRDRSCIDSPE